MKGYIKVCGVSELEEKKGFRYFISETQDIAVFKVEGKIYATDNVCPHNHTPKIHLGFIEDKHVLCPVHFFKFSLQSGYQANHTSASGCTLPVYKVKIIEDEVWVEKPEENTFNFDF
jgi:nitrite reductase/ring-hydroxylating ferredoxin subunit